MTGNRFKKIATAISGN